MIWTPRKKEDTNLMGRKASNAIRTDRIVKTRSNGDRYVYERHSKYKPEKGYYAPIDSHLLGKMKPGSDDKYDLLPLRPKASTKKKEPNTLVSERFHFGMLNIVQHIEKISGIIDDLSASIKNDPGLLQKVRTLAWYDFCSDGSAWTGVRNWSVRYHDLIPYSDTPFTKEMYHDVFIKIESDDSISQSFFAKRAEDLLDGELVALDSSTFVIDSDNVNYGRKTKHKDGRIVKCFKLVVLYSVFSLKPIAFRVIPGQISDSKTVLNAIKQLKAILPSDKSVELVADNGYATDEDLYVYYSEGQKFITRIEADRTWIAKMIDECRDELEHGGEPIDCDEKFSGKAFLDISKKFVKRKTQTEEGATIVKNINVFIYYSSVNKAKEDTNFRRKYAAIKKDLLKGRVLGDEKKEVEKFSQKYMNIKYHSDGSVESVSINKDAYNKHMKYNGFLVVIASHERDLNQALVKFRKREYIEEGIKNIKGHTGGRCARVWSDDALDGEMFCWFVSLCLHEAFETKINYMKETLNLFNGERTHDKANNMKLERTLLKWLSDNSFHEILDWFDVIDYTSVTGNGTKSEWRSELTQRDALFLKLLGIDIGEFKPAQAD